MITRLHFYLICLLVVLSITEAAAQSSAWKKLMKDCNCPEVDHSKWNAEILELSKSPNDIEIRFSQFGMYPDHSIISYNRGQYNAVYYISKKSLVSSTLPKDGIYANRYDVKNNRLDSIVSLLVDKICNWEDPGFTNLPFMDIGRIKIQYKIGDKIGSYITPPPHVLLTEHPEVDAYKTLVDIMEVFKSLTDSVSRIDTKNRGH